ncbi:MAG: hypothetical protein MUW56_03000 [Chryseobacterium sp.]|uniref:hypothetical protein n=1 Tax=Chryseobacterium sp. TaxID=1871047 RepID=UPI0025B9F42D|nr:hypothetical protein [Chryseobacterium sp.]MCJ7932614.1 hypothetical protein [Chryseobacterium sp.]
MNSSEINFKKVNTSELINSLREKKIEVPSKKQIKEVFKKAEQAMASGDYLTARNTLIFTIYFDCDNVFNQIRRKGLFRYSKYINKKCIIKNIATEILNRCLGFEWMSSSIENYLKSIVNYSVVGDSLNLFEGHILREIHAFERKYKGRSLIKTLLAAVDYLFLTDHIRESKNDLSSLSGRTKEEISSAVSFLIYFYTDRVKTRNIDTVFIADEFIMSGDLSRLIIPTCYSLDCKEFEILIDHFDYSCEIIEDRISIKPPFEDFEKAIRLGYIRTDLQLMNDRIHNYDEIVSLEEIIDKLNGQDLFEFFKLVNTHDYVRYVLRVPDKLFDFIVDEFIQSDKLFREEVIYLSSVFKEQLLNFEDLDKIKIDKDLTITEFMKVRRVFILFYLLIKKGIYKKGKIGTMVLLRSLIPSFLQDVFHEFFGKFLSADKIDPFLDVICWEPDLDVIFDLQYQPVLFIEDHFLLSLSVFANSNTIRNLYASQYKLNNTQLLNDGSIDPLVERLHASLEKASIECFSETNIDFSDLDEFAVFGDVLLVFECKHSLHPVSSYDLRTTYDYVKKAEKQLDLIIEDFNVGELKKKLETRCGVNLNGVEKIQGVIVLSNRLFCGNIFKYPVRSINEVDNMVNRGTMQTPEGIFWLWKDKKLTPEFLLEYFSLDNELTALLYESLSPKKLTYTFGKSIIDFTTYSLQLDNATSQLKEFANNLEVKV